MVKFSAQLAEFLSQNNGVIRIEISRARGSSPREQGAEMFVSTKNLWGTIGGGRLEFLAIEEARQMLANGKNTAVLDVPLGPEIGQCCGGRVDLSLNLMSLADHQLAVDRQVQQERRQPHVYILGAGHVGRALANQFQHLPVKCILIDTREEELVQCVARVEIRRSAIPESDIRGAPANSAFIILTHDHGLDFLLTSAALRRGDAAYVGMIGSYTKRRKFHKWARQQVSGLSDDQLICPIGAAAGGDKRPSVIAALVVAEIITELIPISVAETVSETAALAANSAAETAA